MISFRGVKQVTRGIVGMSVQYEDYMVEIIPRGRCDKSVGQREKVGRRYSHPLQLFHPTRHILHVVLPHLLILEVKLDPLEVKVCLV